MTMSSSDPPETIQVIGLGYVGLPTAAMFSTQGYTVFGYDTNPERVQEIKKKAVPFEEPELEALIRAGIESGKLQPSTEPREADAHLLCVPTPLKRDTRTVDLSHIESATRTLIPHLRSGNIVVVESTVPVGTTENVVEPILEESEFTVGEDIHLAMCPETVLPGNVIHELVHNDKIIGGNTSLAAERVGDLYRVFVKGDIVLTDTRIAEFAKLAQNTYRDVNIGLANDLARLAEGLEVDARDAIEVANRHPRVDILQPGPGVGGHCIPIDPWFLLDPADDDAGSLLRKAREVNARMPRYVAQLVLEALDQRGVNPSTAKVALLGLAYKGNVDDVRESPSIEVFEALTQAAPVREVVTTDPHVGPRPNEKVPHSVAFEEASEEADCLVLLTDHDEYEDLDPDKVRGLVRTPLVVDTRGILDRQAWEGAGFTVKRL